MTIFKRIQEVWMPRTLKNNDSLLNFLLVARRSAQFGQKVRWSRWALVIRLVRVVQVVRWSGRKSGQGGHPGWFVRVPPYEILVFLMNFIFFRQNEIISWGKKRSALFQTHD